MTIIIAVLNQKGGVGKTTVTSNLGEAFRRNKLSVLLIDADPQGSLRDWNDASGGEILPVIGMDRITLPKDLDAVKSNYDIIIIDGAPQSDELAGVAISCADFVLIPVTPSPYDVWACRELVDLIKTRHTVTNGKPKAAFLISRATNRTTLGNDVTEALSCYDFDVLNARTVHRQIYAQTAIDGLTVFNSKKNLDAIEEMNKIREEIAEIFNNGI